MERLEKRLENHIKALLLRYPQLISVQNEIIKSYLILEEC